jgi:hypothetical protein
MTADNTSDPATIDALLQAGDIEGARSALSAAPVDDDRFALVRIRLGLYEGSLPPGAGMQRLIQLMRRRPDLPGAKELYQEASQMAYQSRQSSLSYSHPPPKAEEGPKSE